MHHAMHTIQKTLGTKKGFTSFDRLADELREKDWFVGAWAITNIHAARAACLGPASDVHVRIGGTPPPPPPTTKKKKKTKSDKI